MIPPSSGVSKIWAFKNGNRTISPAERLLPKFRRPDLWDKAQPFFFCLVMIDIYAAGTRVVEDEIRHIR